MVNFDTANEINKISAKKYKQGFVTELETERAEKGLSESTIRFISRKKNEPVWMLEWRLKAFKIWQKLKEPNWASLKYDKIDYQNAYYFAAPKGFEN